VSDVNPAIDRKLAYSCKGSIAPVRHPEQLTLELRSAAVGTAACRVPPLEIPLRHARRQAMSAPPRLRS
jgi:hypothetical protein